MVGEIFFSLLLFTFRLGIRISACNTETKVSESEVHHIIIYEWEDFIFFILFHPEQVQDNYVLVLQEVNKTKTKMRIIECWF